MFQFNVIESKGNSLISDHVTKELLIYFLLLIKN